MTPEEEARELNLGAGRQLKALRVAAGHTRESLAALAGINQSQLRKYEDGSNRLSYGRAVVLARALKVGLTAFLE